MAESPIAPHLGEVIAALLQAFEDHTERFGADLPDRDGARARRDLRDTQRDQRWVESLLDTDEHAAGEALSSAVAAYFDRLVRFAYGLVGSVDVAEDIVQETFVRIWNVRHTLRLQYSFRSYLFTAVHRRALDVLKHSGVEERYVVGIQAESEPAGGSVEERMDAAHIEQAVRRAIAQLSERRQTGLRLRYEEELPFAAVAEIMGISEKAAKDLVARAIREIRDRVNIL